MNQIDNLLLKDARLNNQAHLLLWDNPNETDLQSLTFYNNAHRVNYRENLIQRIDPDNKFLILHRYADRELDAIKSICTGVNKSMILLEGLDCLITYLYVRPNSHIDLFWTNLEKTRKLEKLLWILLPSTLAPTDWPENRLKRVT